MDPVSPPTHAEIEAVVRAYLGRVARRYLPLLAGAVVLVLIVVLVPTATPRDDSQAGAVNGALGQPQGATGGTTGTTTAPGAVTAGAAQGTVNGATTGSGVGGGAATTQVPAGPVAPSTSGIARSGVHCGPGKKQVTWSIYAPPCVAKYNGSNGGATTRGVTGSTVTLSYRVTHSADDAAISAATGSAAP